MSYASYAEEILMSLYDQFEDMYDKYIRQMKRKPCAKTVGALEVLNEICWQYELIEDYEYEAMNKKLARWTAKHSQRNSNPKKEGHDH